MAGVTRNGRGGAGDQTPLTPAELNILLSLVGEDLHGYGIMREVERRTGGGTRLGPGTLYRSIKQMLKRGWISEAGEGEDVALGGPKRRYYRLTDVGRRAAALEVERLEELVGRAREAGLRRAGAEPGPSPGLGSSALGFAESGFAAFGARRRAASGGAG